MKAVERPHEYSLRQRLGLHLGPVLLVLTLIFPAPEGLSPEGWATAGVAMLMATFWISEAVPIPVTALLPLVLFPLLGIANVGDAASPYADPLIFLFLGGFVIALAMQKWNLHRRLAINLVGCMGVQPARIVGGFLLASCLISMWVSNTATALMMLPIALSVVDLVPESEQKSNSNRAFALSLLLAIAYGSTTGGMATLIGTPPNSLLAGFMSSTYGVEIGFGQWMMIGLPVTLVALPLVYLVLTRIAFKLDKTAVEGMSELILSERGKLGRLSYGEKVVGSVFVLTASAWVFRPLLQDYVPMLSDTTIAIAGAVILFMIPANLKKGEFIFDWASTSKLPWDVLILFGGGLSLAKSIQKHGLSEYLGQLAQGLGGIPFFITIAIICFGILLLTELTSNTATAATFLPVVAAMAISLGFHPLMLLIPTALAANCSFMMPVGTPPNAIVFGSGLIRLPEMARAGFLLNVILVPVIVAIVWFLAPIVFGFQMGELPLWAK